MMCPTWQQCPCTQDLTVATTRVGGMMRSGSAAVARVTSAWYSDDQNSAVPGVGQLSEEEPNSIFSLSLIVFKYLYRQVSFQDVVNIDSSTANRRPLACVHGVDQPQHAGRVDAAVRHHVVRAHDLGEHVLEQRHEPGHGAAHRQEQGDQQLLRQRARAPRGGVVQRRGVAAGAHQVQACHQISIIYSFS